MRQWRRSIVFIVNFEQISHIALGFPLLTLNKWTSTKNAPYSWHIPTYNKPLSGETQTKISFDCFVTIVFMLKISDSEDTRIYLQEYYTIINYKENSTHCFSPSELIGVHGKTTYEWHTDDIQVHIIWVTYGWHTSTYEWHTDDIRVRTSDIRVTYEYIRVTYGWRTSIYEWHTDDIRKHTSDMRIT